MLIVGIQRTLNFFLSANFQCFLIITLGEFKENWMQLIDRVEQINRQTVYVVSVRHQTATIREKSVRKIGTLNADGGAGGRELNAFLETLQNGFGFIEDLFDQLCRHYQVFHFVYFRLQTAVHRQS